MLLGEKSISNSVLIIYYQYFVYPVTDLDPDGCLIQKNGASRRLFGVMMGT